VIRYKPVAKLSGKLGAKKGGMNRNPAGSAAAEPLQVISNNSNNNDSSRLEKVAHIYLKTPNDLNEYTDEYDEKIIQLGEIDGDIFDIRITTNVDYVNGISIDKTNIWIYSKNISKAKKKENYEKQRTVLIDVLKYFKKAADNKLFDTNFRLFESDESYTSEHNELLKLLAEEIKK
jgi:hypothetical protein